MDYIKGRLDFLKIIIAAVFGFILTILLYMVLNIMSIQQKYAGVALVLMLILGLILIWLITYDKENNKLKDLP